MSRVHNGYGPPTVKTRAEIGERYVDLETCKAYECVAIVPSDPIDYGFVDIHQAHNDDYEWVSYTNSHKITDFYNFCNGGFYRVDDFFNIDLTGATNFNSACKGLTNKYTHVPYLDTRNGTLFISMFENCSYVKTMDGIDTRNGKNFSKMFCNCGSLKYAPQLDTHNGTNFTSMFEKCYALLTAPELDVTNGTTFDKMFYTCSSLTEVPALNVVNGTIFSSMFFGCKKLVSVGRLTTSNGSSFSSMFDGCAALSTVSGIDMNGAQSTSSMFAACAALTNLTVYNIRASLQIGSGTSWGHLLTVDSLVHTIKELCTVTTQQTLTMGSANLAKIADLYCKVNDDTTEKIDMELCDSTDEGAMTLAEYAMLKNWVFA